MHYARMKELEERLSKASAFASAFFDWVIDLKQSQSDAHHRFAELFCGGRDMVASFGDVLPVGTFEVDGLGIAPNVTTVTYRGPVPPLSRFDELGSALVSFMNRGPRSVGIGTTSVSEQRFLICLKDSVNSLLSCKLNQPTLFSYTGLSYVSRTLRLHVCHCCAAKSNCESQAPSSVGGIEFVVW
jgi:hypothetical protein